MEMQFGLPGFKVNIAEWLELADFQFGELHKYASVSSESLKVAMALTI